MTDISPQVQAPASIPQDSESTLDSETAALLRAALQPAFDKAESWPALLSALQAKGFALAFHGGRLILIETDRGGRLCTTRFLGRPLSDLVARLGRPAVRALPGRLGAGELLG